MTRNVHLLFICSRNKWRSPTAEQVWKNKLGYNVRSAGTSSNAKRTVGPEDIRWSDIIFVMEKKHRNRLVSTFTRLLSHKPIHILDIADEYQYMDPELMEDLEAKIGVILDSNQMKG